MIAFLAFVFSTVTVTSVPNPRTNNAWVTDQANILDAAAEARLNALAEGLNKAKGIELAIVVVDDVNETPKAFATALFNHWKIGNAQTNTGVLVLLVMGKRRLEIETGKGIEAALTAQWLSEMQQRDMVPRFKQKDFAGGLETGVNAIVQHLNAAPSESTSTAPTGTYIGSNGEVVTAPAPTTVPSDTPRPASTPTPSSISPPKEEDSPARKVAAGGVGVLAVGGVAAGLFARKRRRTCTKCQPNLKMFKLDEVEDDKHLDAGQRKEENVGSVDYEVLICRGCQETRILRHNKWFSGKSMCKGCNYKLLTRSSRTVVSATYDHGGQVEVTESCSGCSYNHSFTRYTSALTRPSTSSSSYSSSSSSYSSSSSGGGSSFSGGSSSGGGAGSSW